MDKEDRFNAEIISINNKNRIININGLNDIKEINNQYNQHKRSTDESRLLLVDYHNYIKYTKKWQDLWKLGLCLKGDSNEITMPIPREIGFNTVVCIEGKYYFAEKRDIFVSLNITNYSYVNRHFYGRLKVLGNKVKINEFNYSSDSWKSNITEIAPWLKEINIEVTRKLTERDINEQPNRYEKSYYKVGNFINAFNSKEDLIRMAKEEFKRIFINGWKFKINDN